MRVIEPTNGQRPTHWSHINWTQTEANVRRIQGRIFRATAAGDFQEGQEPTEVNGALYVRQT